MKRNASFSVARETSLTAKSFKAALIVAVTCASIPYAISIVLNVVYGWPVGKDKYKRALHPRKVYLLNVAAFRQLANVRYLPLYIRWKYFYASAGEEKITRNVPFGKNGNCLDVYRTQRLLGGYEDGLRPVVVFIYGGSWGSGDKSMYGLLCNNLADELGVVVCCLNYSIYPKGFVDDMVQDVADCLIWIHGNISSYGGDKQNIILMGHSAGAHLAAMATLELQMKRLLGSYSASHTLGRGGDTDASILFRDEHFGSRTRLSSHSDNNVELEMVSEAPSVDDNGGLIMTSLPPSERVSPVLLATSTGGPQFLGELASSATAGTQDSSTFCVVSQPDSASLIGATSMTETLSGSIAPSTFHVSGHRKAPTESFYVVSQATQPSAGPSDVGDAETTTTTFSAVVSVPTDKRGELEEVSLNLLAVAENPSLSTSAEPQLQRSMSRIGEISTSVKLVIGLAGVYNISDHFEFEYGRGVEDISTMTRAMYGPELFERFSPSVIVGNLPRETSLPPFVFVHGDADTTVPLSSSRKMLQALTERGDTQSRLTIIKGCGHTDVCLGLMNATSRHYVSVMQAVQEAFDSHIFH